MRARPTPAGIDSALLAPSTDLNDLVDELASLGAIDEQQEDVRTSMLEFARAHPDALHRSCAEGHFTGSAVVVQQRTGRVVLLLHTKLRKWLQPGGHTDGEANLAVTALREATEETGIAGLRILPEPIDLDIHEVRPPSEPPHLHHDIRYLVLAPEESMPVGNHESQSVRWFAPGDVSELGVDESVTRLVRRGLAVATQLPEAGLG
jgi:8-oxo-dGTP pyrophosphatase MutT (NUDIX family)